MRVIGPLETIVKQWQDSLFRIAFRVLCDTASAEDLRQNVFLRLLESTETLRGLSSLAPGLAVAHQ